MHVLSKVHCSLRPGGVLLDTHPEPEHPSVEVRLAEGRGVPVGSIDASSLISNIHAARASLGQLIASGRYRAAPELNFEFLAQHASVDAWLAYREHQEATSKVGDQVIAHARTALAESPGVVVVRERSRALSLTRL